MAERVLLEAGDGLKETSSIENEVSSSCKATTGRSSIASFSMAHALSIARRRKEEQRIAEEEKEKAEEEDRKEKARAKRRRRRHNQKLTRAKLKAELTERSKEDQNEAEDQSDAVNDEQLSLEGDCDQTGAGKRLREEDSDSAAEQSCKRQRGEQESPKSTAPPVISGQQAPEALNQDQPVKRQLTLIPRALLIKKSNHK